jgi:peptidoglycan/LPS O-acetylase OafA/YrhL
MAVGWSVSTEAFFYLTFPLFVFPIARFIRRGSHALTAVAIIYVALMTIDALVLPLRLKAWEGDYGLSGFHWGLYFSPYARLGEFLTGAIVGQYFLSQKDHVRSMRNRDWWVGALVLGVCIFLMARGNYWILKKPHSVTWLRVAISNILFAPLCAGVIYYLAALPCLLQRVMGSRVMVELGNASYAMYLIHLLGLAFFHSRLTGEGDMKDLYVVLYDNLAMVACVHFLSLGLYRYAEVPLRDGIRRLLDPKKEQQAPSVEVSRPRLAEGTQRAA